MKISSYSLMTWLPGPVLALAGVIGVRWLAPFFTGRTQAIIIVVGYMIVPIGLFWFASRLGQRAAQRSISTPAPNPRN